MSSDETLLGIDIGTSSSKGIVATPDGKILAQATRPHGLAFPRPGWAEHDAEEVWWADVRVLCRELLPHTGDGLRGVCVSGIGPAVVLCDDQVRPLRPAILYGIDSRATAEIAELELRFGRDRIFARGGSVLSSQAAGPKLLWLRRHEPEIWSRAAGWYSASSFVVARLTGEYVIDHHTASQFDPLYDLDRCGWADDWTGEITAEMPIPRLAWAGEQVGVITAAAAEATGIPAGTPVAAGTVDAWAEAFSVSVRSLGDVMVMYGSTLFLIQVADREARHEMLWSTQGVEPGRPTIAAGMSTAGTLVEWVRTLTGGPTWAELDRELDGVPAGSGGVLVLPYFAGERTPVFDPDARGVIAGLSLTHGRGHLVKACFEGIACGIRQILELFEKAAGRPARCVAVGGGTASPSWLQAVSDITGISQEVPVETSGAAYGDALLAAIASGLVSPETGWANVREVVAPDERRADLYAEIFENYCRLYPATAQVSQALAAMQVQTS